MSSLEQRIADVERAMRGIPSRWAGGGRGDTIVSAWLTAVILGGNTVNASAPTVTGIKHVAGEALTDQWLYLPKRATATATVSAGGVNGLYLTDNFNQGGQGYASAPVVTIAPPLSGTQATGHATIGDNYSIAACKITNCGSGYWQGATVAFSGTGMSEAATGTVITRLGKVVGITIINKGKGFTVTATATITPISGGSAATADCIMEKGRVLTLVVDTAGTGYTTPPTVSIAAPSYTPSPLTGLNDGIGFGRVLSAYDSSIVVGSSVRIVNDDRATLGFPLVVSVVDSGITVQGSDAIISWAETMVRFDDQDMDADGCMPCWVPMGGGE